MTTMEPFELITREKAAKFLHIGLTTLDAHIDNGDIPAPRTIGGGRQLYWLSDVFYAAVRRSLQAEGATTAATPARTAPAAKAPRDTTASRTQPRRATGNTVHARTQRQLQQLMAESESSNQAPITSSAG